MSTQLLDALSRLAARRFGSFADAATQVFDLLESACPGGNLVLGQIDWDEGKCRVIDARGDGVPRGAVIPLARGVPVNGSPRRSCSTPSALEALGPANWVAAPLDAADGSVVGLLLATGPAGEAPSRALAQLIVVGARLLSYEWESISARAELRRLAERARDRASTDPVTGLPNRETLVTSIEREHELSKRGTVESFLVVCHLRDRDALVSALRPGHGEPPAEGRGRGPERRDPPHRLPRAGLGGRA